MVHPILLRADGAHVVIHLPTSVRVRKLPGIAAVSDRVPIADARIPGKKVIFGSVAIDAAAQRKIHEV